MMCLVIMSYHIWTLQVLVLTSFSRTLLTVHATSDGDHAATNGTLFSLELTDQVSNYTAVGLQPATPYLVVLSLLFVGGGQGSHVEISQTTLDGGLYLSTHTRHHAHTHTCPHPSPPSQVIINSCVVA